MPAPTLIAGAPCWIDLYTSDTAAATAFYSRLFGWSAEQPQEGFGGYFTFTKDGKHVGGCMHNDGEAGVPDVWTVYLTTDDIGRVAEVAPAHGGRVDVPPMAIAENGSMAMVADPGHASVGVWQPGAMTGFEVLGEAGTPRWFELLTRDYDASVAFYRNVFAWDAHVAGDTADFRYTTLGEGEHQLAGIMDATAFSPRARPRPGRSTSASPTPTRRCRRSSSSEERSPSRPRTRPTAGWPRQPTRRERGSSWSTTFDRGLAPDRFPAPVDG